MVKLPKAGVPAVRSPPGVPGAASPFFSNSLNSRVVGIDEIRPYENQVRSRTRKSLKKLARSIDRFGQIVPVVVDQQYEVVDGHSVLEALKALGRRDVWVVIVAGRSDAEIRALRLALNRLPEDAAWRDDALRREFQVLMEVGFDLDLSGFAPVEIDHVVEVDVPKLNRLEDDDIPALLPYTVTTRGDVWICGEHRLGCGDAKDAAFIDRLLLGTRADACIIDPPFNLSVRGFISGKGAQSHREFVEASGEMSGAEFENFLTAALRVLATVSKPSALLFVFIDWRHVLELLIAGRRCGLTLGNICVWAKTNAGMGGNLYRSQHEFVALFKAGTDPNLNNVELGRHGRNRSNLWTYRGMSSFGNERDATLALHPTSKPVLMIADAIRDCTKRGDVVVDTFLGSGSALMAAEETARVFVGSDLDPAYVDVAVRRWQANMRRDAINEATGETFDETADRAARITEGQRDG
jgi:DNA modification methylase